RWYTAAGRSAAISRATASRSSRSTARQRTRESPAAADRPDGFDHAATSASCSRRCSTRWLPANPAAPVTRETRATVRTSAPPAVLGFVVRLEGGIFLLDGTPPPLVLAVPLHRVGQSLLEIDARAPVETSN